MGDSGAEDTSDSLTDADLDQIASDAEAIQEGPKSNIVGSSSYDAQFTADQLEDRGLDPSNFMAAENFAQTTQGGFTGGTGPQETTINVPSVQAAGTTPTFSAAGVSDVFDPMTMQARSDTMVEALGAAPSTTETRGTPSFDAFGDPVTVQSFLPAAVTVDRTAPQTQQQKGLAALTQTLNQARDKGVGMGDERGIDFGVTAPVDAISIDVPSNVTVGRGQGFSAEPIDAPNTFSMGAYTSPVTTASNLAAMQDAMNKGTISGVTTGPEMIAGVPRSPNAAQIAEQILTDQRRMQQGQIPSRAEDPFDPDVGAPFDVGKLEQMEAIMAQPNVMPGMLGIVEDRTKDALATSIALGRNVTPIEGIFGFTAPDMTKDKETIEEFNARTGRSIPPDQIVTDAQGVVIGLKDARGNLVTGRDPSAQMQGDDSPDPQKKVPPKQPTDPCPEGFQLIDGKCTPVGGVETDTGFVVFPPGRDPAFKRGPFTPATVASNPGIRGLNPITFNIPQNIFRR